MKPLWRRPHSTGQALVEFSLAIIIFLVLIMGVFDFGKGIYQLNGVSQAAREIARVTTVHRDPACPPTCPCPPACTSPETLAVIATQKGLVPSLGDPTFACVDQTGAIKLNSACHPGDSIRVTITAPYTTLTPFLRLVNGSHPPCAGLIFACLQASSTVKIQ